jgi:NAD(P)-dependent dehydrogenase (short-subunit alcohol dehydrogenase family)
MLTDMDLRGLRVAITGGTSGLGLALVRLLVARGAQVAFVARLPMRSSASPMRRGRVELSATSGARKTSTQSHCK